MTSYSADWGRHYFKAMVGFQAELQENSSGFTYKDGMLSDDVFSFDNAAGNLVADEARGLSPCRGWLNHLSWVLLVAR